VHVAPDESAGPAPFDQMLHPPMSKHIVMGRPGFRFQLRYNDNISKTTRRREMLNGLEGLGCSTSINTWLSSCLGKFGMVEFGTAGGDDFCLVCDL